MRFQRSLLLSLALLLSGLVAPASLAQTRNDQLAAARNNEVALYQQRPLLDNALAKIARSDPAQINLYFLGVAGDGTQEVFRREVEFVHQQFDRDFGTAGRSMMLINSRSTVGSQPMATRLNLRVSLEEIARKMDREKDILFLFLTSHGSREHELALALDGMDLPDLPATELASLLKQQRIRWKVIVVSACYAGGFIAPLQDDHTLIITAARQDRSSFGCADDNDFTYFGRAYFKEALPKSPSFDTAFRTAAGLINQWEQRDRLASSKNKTLLPSLPQMVSPAPILRYLAQWQGQRSRAAH